MRRFAADQHVLLAVAIVIAAQVIEVVSQSRPFLVVGPSIAFLIIQMLAGLPGWNRKPRGLDTARLILALGAVMWMSIGSGEPATLPLASLILPIIAMAAAIGAAQVLVVGGVSIAIALIMYNVPGLATPTIQTGLVQRGVALAATAVVLAVGTRRTVSMLERAIAHAQAASRGLRRRSRQMAAIEEAGRLLATDGPTAAAMDAVVGLLVDRFGYRYVSIYTRDGALMRLRSQRGYDEASRRSMARSAWWVGSCGPARPPWSRT